MGNWKIDADDIRIASDFDDDLLYKTRWIDNFLFRERESKLFVIATKGFGKTFLLKAKRIKFQEYKDIICLPVDELLDKPIGNTNFDSVMCNYYSSTQVNWTLPWLASIIISILKHLNLRFTLDSPRLTYLENPEIRTVSDHFITIMGLGRESLFDLIKITTDNLLARARDIHSPVAIFIDNVDEYFKTHIMSSALRRSDVGELSSDIWYFSQIGLVEAAYQIQRMNHHIKLFCSIRKEAFLRIKHTSDMYQQYMGSSVDVQYSMADLKEIFFKNIRKERVKNLVFPAELVTNPILSFLGLEQITHSISGEKEELFDYIHRHTLQRPRDFMSIGDKISNLPPHERNEENLKSVINQVASEISHQYTNEVLPHLGVECFDKLLSLIDSNVLTKKRVCEICSTYNNVSCVDRDCKKCVNSHVFCDLFKAGLLGYKIKDLTNNRIIQEFVLPGERTFDPYGLLPDSSYYFVHPILYERIRILNTFFEDNISPLVVGYNKPWKKNRKAYSGKSVVYVACHPDDEVLSSGVLLSKLTRLEYNVTLIWISSGENSSSPDATSRRDEALKVSESLGVTPIFLSELEPNLELHDMKMNIASIMTGVEKQIKSLNPDLVVWPFGLDEETQHQDHVALHKAMKKMMSRSDNPNTCWLSSQPPVDQDKNFHPTVFLPYDDKFFKNKMNMFRMYRSELTKPFAAKDSIKEYSRHWKKQGKHDMPYVEPYEIERGIPPKDVFE